MTAKQFSVALRKLGLSQAEAARQLGVERNTVWRWCDDRLPVPGPVAAWVRLALSQRES